jgi:hypothetical protein
MEDSRPCFVLQNSHGQAKEFLRNLQTIWACDLKKVRQPCYRPCKNFKLQITLSYRLLQSITHSQLLSGSIKAVEFLGYLMISYLLNRNSPQLITI